MKIVAVGISYKNTPLEVREKFCLTSTEQSLFLSKLKNNPAIYEAFVFSTCNRVEVYAHVLDEQLALETLCKTIFDIKKLPYSIGLSCYFYNYVGHQAIEHLLSVAAGLDSMILGERQILGQIKSAFERAREYGMFGKYFNILSNTAIRTGKKSRNETSISVGGSSLSWAAIVKAEEIMGGTLHDKSILIIGAGKMSGLAAEQISKKGAKKVYVMNRTMANARSLAEKCGGEAVAFSDLKEILSKVDMCFCSSGCPHYVLDKETVQNIMSLRNTSQLIFIDISMPRNIDPEVSGIDNVVLYKIDDLKEVVDSNMEVRKASVKQVRTIIAAKLSEYYKKLTKLKKKELSNAQEGHYLVGSNSYAAHTNRFCGGGTQIRRGKKMFNVPQVKNQRRSILQVE